jgi:hypothetical protein
MDNLYYLHLWSKLHQQEMLREARERQLVAQARANRGRRSAPGRVGIVRATGGSEAEKNRVPIWRKLITARSNRGSSVEGRGGP